MLRIAVALLVGALAWTGEAQAVCPAGTPIDCTTSLADTMSDGSSTLGDYRCGSPYANLEQRGPEKIYTFSCPAAGNLRVDLAGANCDLDLYALGGMCDPASAECLAGSTFAPPSSDGVNVTCEAGMTIAFVVEGYGFGPGGDCPRNPGATYTILVDAGSPVCVAVGCAGCVDDGVSPAVCSPGDAVTACGSGAASCQNCDDGDPCTADACSGGVCESSILCVPCVDDAGCAPTGFCGSDGICAPILSLGGTCDRDTMCGSGHCVDGVCCASVCDGACEMCDPTGVCVDVPACGLPDAPPGGPDAMTTDAGAGDAGGAATDAATTDDDGKPSDGCGCRVPAPGGARGMALAAALLVTFVLLARARRHR
jgi:hypothetical protein